VVIPLARHLERWSPLSGPESRRCCLCGARHVPRAPLPETGATRLRGMSGIPSEGTTPPSSLLRAHAPHQTPLADLGLHPIPRVLAGCGEPLLEGGGSRRYLRNPCIGAWSHTPPRSPGAPTRFFPVDIGLTSHLTRSARETLLQSNFHRVSISGLQTFLYVQAPMLARPPGCTYRIHRWAAGPFTPRNGPEVTLRNCGIATCLNRAIGTAGLSPAGLRPCRPLHKC
jgi:hypothetical protein